MISMALNISSSAKKVKGRWGPATTLRERVVKNQLPPLPFY
jgi:hypothetical protein